MNFTATILFLMIVLTTEAGPRPLSATNNFNSTLTNSPLKQIEPGIFEIGQVRLDKNKKSIQFPIQVNMNQGTIEYLLVTSSGKLHESLLRTEAEPRDIHLAVLLLFGDVVTTNSADSTNIYGLKVNLFVQWKTRDADKKIRAEDLIFNAQTKSPMSRGPWIYNGSRIVAGTFLAQRDGSIISTIADPDALINNPRPGRENDDIWQVNSNNVPPPGTPGQLIVNLETDKIEKKKIIDEPKAQYEK
ncbi:MAG: YdjY domain-containing protein [Verrucomicrobiota bacterium]|nr:YdjY domain-containing protein [Verrucomicrobiota bacterium]